MGTGAIRMGEHRGESAEGGLLGKALALFGWKPGTEESPRSLWRGSQVRLLTIVDK